MEKLMTPFEQAVYDEIVEYFVQVAVDCDLIGMNFPYNFSSKEAMYQIYWNEVLN